ncbi:MAG: glycosyl hydrolase family 28-related protein [Rhodovarius sp.]|nr:glycosyl hydrolase family 28-related protein [Rhodovarius sp.]
MAEHIRIGDIAPRIHYATDGVQNAFTFPFPIFSAADLQVRLDGLPVASGFSVQGAGRSEGGQVVFDTPPPAGRRLTLLRRLRLARTSDFQDNGVLRARVLNDELDYQVAALQELRDEIAGAIRLDPSESAELRLPPAAARANRVLGFNATGGIALLPQGGLVTSAFPGAVPRSVEDKLAESLSVRDFGAVGDGVADDGPALQAAMSAAAASGRLLVIGEGTWRTTMPLTLPGEAAGLVMSGVILYAGPTGVALTIGNGGTYRTATRRYLGLRVQRATQSDWQNEDDIGIRLVNLDACLVEIRQAEGFTIGVQTLGDARGFEDSTLHLGRIVNNRIGLDVRCATAAGWNNSVVYVGGHFANASSVHPTMSRFGVRFSAAPGAYNRHNAHVFLGPAFELQRQGTPGTVDAIPFLVECGDARCIIARGIRMEQCSPVVARHVGGSNDCVYEVGYNGTYGFTGATIDYAPGATRAGGSVVCYHQAAAVHHAPRLVAEAANVRARAFRQTVDAADGIGFDEMAVLSSNPNGPPTDLNGFCFAGLSLITLNSDSVGLPTSRALAFVVDASECKEFVIAAEGTSLRPIVMQFDANEQVLGASAPILFSNMNAVFAGSPSFWWEGNVNLDTLTAGLPLNRLQRVTLHPSARFAVLGVRGGTSGATLTALRIFAPATHAPRLIYGGPRRWGVREYTVQDPDWVVPSLGPGATATRDVTLPGVRQGDFVSAGFAKTSGFQNGGVIFHASVGGTAGTNQVRVTAHNVSSGTINVGAGTLFVRAVKPRL